MSAIAISKKRVGAIRREPKTRPEGLYVKLARARHERDLKEGHKRGLWFDEESAEHVRDFFPKFLKHSKGKFKGKPYQLEDWQYRDSVGPLFGWKRLPGKMTAKDAEKIPRKDRREAGILRRFNTSYKEIARKNGKSTEASGMANYLLVADGEGAPEVYWAATTLEQTLKLFREPKRMILQSPALSRLCDVREESILCRRNFGSMMPLASDPTKLDGLNSSGVFVDELHAHASVDLYDVLRTSVGSRDQPMVSAITTAGVNRLGPCWRERSYVCRLLEGRHHDDSYFGTIYTIDEDDDWRDEACWMKANPGLGTIRNERDLRDLFNKAMGSPASQASFRRYYLNEWLQAEARAIDRAFWTRSRGPLNWQELAEAMAGRECVGGLDMATRYDIAALALSFRRAEESEPLVVVPHFWMPEATVEERGKSENVPYQQWVDEGAIHAIPGEVIDHEVMLGDIVRYVRPHYEISNIQYDPWNAAWLVNELERYRFVCTACKPCFTNLNEATKHLLAMIRVGRVQHGGHPVMDWMAENLVIHSDRAGNMMPDRKRSREKIDGFVGWVMAIRGLITEKPEEPSVYRKRGAMWIGKG